MELKKTLSMPKGTFEMRGNLAQKEPLLLKKWEDVCLYQLMLEKNQGKKEFYLHDGPPYANGDMHCGHTLNRILKDIIVRYKNMSGFYTPFVPGWDTHGLPIETAISKKGIDRKKMPLSEFRTHCEKYAYTQVERQKAQVKRLGIMGDFAHPYLTLTKEFEAEQLSLFKEMALKGFIFKGFKPVYWSWSSESALAEAEIEYHDVTSQSIYVKFPVVEETSSVVRSGDCFVCWTTTPWTIPANLAVCVNPNFDYGIYECDQGRLIMMMTRSEEIIAELKLTNVYFRKKFQGKEVEGLHVSHPFYDRDSLVICGNHVTADAGTGCVHTAPGHGVDDYNVGSLYGLPSFCPVDDKGVMNEDAGERLKGVFYEKANDIVISMLVETGRLLGQKEITHSYPHDWRTNKPVIFRATPQWFCSIEKIREKLFSAIDSVSWNPTWGKLRMHNMVEMRGDWCISRQRAWGVPIPIIYGEDGTPLLEEAIFDHIINLVKLFGSNVWFEYDVIDLLPKGYKSIHSPNGIFKKETDIMDVWFDSGSSFKAVNIARNHQFPADLYLEGTDQYRGWFNSSLIISVATSGVAPYKEVLTHGFVQDKDGNKMSKSLGNGVDPIGVCNNYGADILRLWVASIDFQNDVKISDDIIKGVSESYRKIRNTFKFLLANLYDDETTGYQRLAQAPSNLLPVDKMILAKLEAVKNQAIAYYDCYDFSNAYMVISSFMAADLSSFYLDIAKDVLYCDDVKSSRRKNTQYVLDTLATTLAKLLNPLLPFTMQEVNDHLITPLGEYMQLVDFPSVSHDFDQALLQDYAFLLKERTEIYREIENARNEKTIASSANADVEVFANKEQLAFFEKFDATEFTRMMNISRIKYTLATDTHITVKMHSGEKCDRCWNYFDETTTVGEEHLCSRCREVVKQYEE